MCWSQFCAYEEWGGDGWTYSIPQTKQEFWREVRWQWTTSFFKPNSPLKMQDFLKFWKHKILLEMYIHSPNSKTVFHTVFPSLLQNENRLLWKLGTLPPGLLTFYKLTHPLDKSWHVLGLGYNPTIERSEIDNAAVIHYNGNMKPWLEIAMTKYRPYWTKYINYEHSYIHGCKISQ